MQKQNFQRLLVHFYGVFVALVTFWVYVKTLAPTVSFFDSGELIAAAYSLGVAHPPGYPLYVLLGWVFSKFPVGNVAWRLNLMSAFFAALASLMVYYMSYTIITQCRRGHHDATPDAPLPIPHAPIQNPKPKIQNSQHPDPERMLAPILSMSAALLFAFSLTHWRHAVVAEVYSLGAFFSGMVLLLLVKWWQYQKAGSRQQAVRKSWILYLTAWLFGLGFGNHQTIVLLVFAAGFLVLITTPYIIFRVRTLLVILVCGLLGLSIYLLIPLRAVQNPPINWGNATTLRQFQWVVTREGYKNVARGHALSALWKDLLQHEASHDNTAQKTRDRTLGQSLLVKQLKSFNPLREFGYMGLALAVLGVIYGLIGYRVISVTLLIAVVSLVGIVVIIGDPPEENIFLLEEFHTPAYLIVAVWIGMGMMAIAHTVLWVASKRRNLQYALVFVLALYFLIPPGNQMLSNLAIVDRRQNYVAYDYAANVLTFLQPNAILFTWGDSGAFPLWYLQIVEKTRPDVTLIHMPHLSTEWYIDLLPQHLFPAENTENDDKDAVQLIEEIVRHNIASRPIYFDFSSAHSVMLPYQLLPYGAVYKVLLSGDELDEEIWTRYSFRGILDDTRIARDPDIERTFLMYGSAHIELGNYYLQLDELDKAAQAFNAAVQFEPSLGDQIVRELRFRDKLAGESPQQAPKSLYRPDTIPQRAPN